MVGVRWPLEAPFVRLVVALGGTLTKGSCRCAGRQYALLLCWGGLEGGGCGWWGPVSTLLGPETTGRGHLRCGVVGVGVFG